MDGLLNKFLSVLREVTDEDKQEANGENQETNDDKWEINPNKQKINEDELKTSSMESNSVKANGTTVITPIAKGGLSPDNSKSESPESTPSSSSDLRENLTLPLETNSSSEEKNSATVNRGRISERREQYIDIVPVEGLPDPPPNSRPAPEYTPSLQHSPSHGPFLQRDRAPSPSLFDRSIEFLKREFDSLRFSLGSYFYI